MSNKPPKINIPGLNRGAGVPAGYILGRRRGTGQGPAQLLDLNQIQALGVATTPYTAQGLSSGASTAHSETTSLSTSVSTSLSQISSSLSGAVSSTTSLSSAVSTVISGSISSVNSRVDSLSTAGGGGSGGSAGPSWMAIDGQDGEQGMPIPGVPGTPGAVGSTGAAGPQGPIGFAIDGLDGEEGTPIPGAAGATGPTGAVGPQGPIGFGMDGEEGPEGLAIPGVPGAAGATGGGGLTVGAFDTLSTAQADSGNTTTTETDIFTYTILASQMATNGDRIELDTSGTFVSSATATRQMRAYFGGTLIFDTGALTINVSGAVWVITCDATRVSATVVRCTVDMETEGAALASYTSYVEVTGLTLSNTNIIKITGTAAGVGAATNDIVCKMGAVEFKPSTPDIISSSVQGDILYRNATVWTRLPAGTSGQFLKTQGAGANPTWAAGGGGAFTIGFEIDGGGADITTGFKGFSSRIPAAHTITKVTALSVDTFGPATSCSITVDVWADTYTNFPPTSSDKISASAPVTLSSAVKSEDSALSGWTISISANSIYGFSVASVTGAKKILVLIEATA